MSVQQITRPLYVAGEPTFCTQHRTKPMQVLVVGLFRTGTTSVTDALTQLGYTCYNERDLISRKHGEFWERALRAKYYGEGRPFELEQWESVLADSQVVSGMPSAALYPELLTAYPNSLVILTTRPEDAWLRSLLATLWLNYTSLAQRFVRRFHPVHRKSGRAVRVFWHAVFWDDVPRHGRRVFREHEARVRRVVPRERLFVVDVTKDEGWGALCGFLGKEVPVGREFPRTNSVGEYHRQFSKGRPRAVREVLVGWVLWGVPVVAVGVLVAYWMRGSGLKGLRRLLQ